MAAPIRFPHFNLLGRLDVFDKFNVSFRERDGVVIFEPVE